MRAAEARSIAERWIHDVYLPGVDARGLVGAWVGGSLASRTDDDDFDEDASDVDLFLVVDPDVIRIDRERLPHGCWTLHDDVIIQAVPVPAEVIEDESRLLGMLGLGSNLRHGRILYDPSGRVERALHLVRKDWKSPTWIAHRTARAIEFAEQAIAGIDQEASDPARLLSLADAVGQLAGVLAIAQAVTPTHRRALALSRGLLERQGRLDLHERLLAAIGADSAGVSDVEQAAADASAALAVELHYGGDPSLDDTDEFRERLRVALKAGLAEMIEEGDVREAVLPAIGSIALSATAVMKRAEPADRVTIDRLVDHRLNAIGVSSTNWAQRHAEVNALGQEISAYARSLAARSPVRLDEPTS
jgi:hypothetical protein